MPLKNAASQRKQPALAEMGEERTGKHKDTGLRTVAWSSEGPGDSCTVGVSWGQFPHTVAGLRAGEIGVGDRSILEWGP